MEPLTGYWDIMLVRAGCTLGLPEDLENKEQLPGSESGMRDLMKDLHL